MSEDHIVLRGDLGSYLEGDRRTLPGLDERVVRSALAAVGASLPDEIDQLIVDVGTTITWDLLLVRDEDGRPIAVEGGVYLDGPPAEADVREVYRRVMAVAATLDCQVWPTGEDPEDAEPLDVDAMVDLLLDGWVED